MGTSKLSLLKVAFAACWIVQSACSLVPNIAPDALRVGSKALEFDPQKVDRLTIARMDPETGSSWNASFSKVGEDWRVDSAPNGLKPLDRRAHTSLIRHLLDTLATLQISEKAPKGAPATFGLDRPWASLRLGAASREWEIRIAAPRSSGPGQFAILPKISDTTVVEVRGAALQMIHNAPAFEDLRLRQFSVWSTDEVEEISVTRNGKAAFYAERAGSDWEDQRKRKIRKDVDRFIADLTHTRVQAFVDDEATTERVLKLGKVGEKNTAVKVTMKNLQGEAQTLSVVRDGERTYGISDAREGAVFELYPQTQRLLERGP